MCLNSNMPLHGIVTEGPNISTEQSLKNFIKKGDKIVVCPLLLL